MEEKEFSIACSQVISIIEKSSKEIQKKIPKKFIEFLEKSADGKKIDVNLNEGNIEDIVTQDAIAILGLIYRDYIVSKEERNELLKKENEETQKYENELREKYNPDNIFQKKKIEKEPLPQVEEVQLVEIKEASWFKKAINKILNIFGIKK